MIHINLNKAKIIGHDKRRAKAQEMFAPYDKIIELNIPGQEQNRVEAEAQRAIIRQKDSACQIAIDASTTTDQIKEALDSFV
jgi:hypothetical protein